MYVCIHYSNPQKKKLVKSHKHSRTLLNSAFGAHYMIGKVNNKLSPIEIYEIGYAPMTEMIFSITPSHDWLMGWFLIGFTTAHPTKIPLYKSYEITMKSR